VHVVGTHHKCCRPALGLSIAHTPVGRTVCSADRLADRGGDGSSPAAAELVLEHRLAVAGQPWVASA